MPAALTEPSSIAGIVAPMVGRDSELQQLLTHFYGLLESGGVQLITILGEPGIGKSRLIYAFYHEVRRLPEAVRFYRFQGDPQRTAQHYGLVRQLITALFSLSESDPPEVSIARLEQGVAAILGVDSAEKAHFLGFLAGFELEASPYLSGIRQDVRQIRDRALHAAIQIIARLTAHTPMVLVIEDTHYVDESSIAMIEQVAQASDTLSLLIICLGQPRLLERWPNWGKAIADTAQINLASLDERDSRRLVAEILRKAGKLPHDLRNLIVSRSEGNPFYIEELIKMLIADGVILPAADKWQIQVGRLPRLRVPSTLAELLRSRLQLLSQDERAFLTSAAVIGRAFWVGATLALTDPPRSSANAEPILRALVSRSLITPQPESLLRGEHEYRFSHDLLREVIYEQLMPEQRAAQHRRVATWLIAQSGPRTTGHASLIADHFERGGDPRQAGHWHARAGAQAQATYAVDAAIAHYRQAITLLGNSPEELPEQLACYEGLAFLQHEVAHLGEALITYRQMRGLAVRLGDKRAESRALVQLSMVHDDASEPHKAYQHARDALALAMETGDRSQIIFSIITLSPIEARLGSPQAGLDLGMRALMFAREINQQRAIGKALNSVGLAYEQLGNYVAAMQSMRESVTIYRELGDLSEVATQLNNMSYIAHNGGDFAASHDYAREGLMIARSIGSQVNEIYLLSNLGAALIGLGDYQQAEAITRQGIHLSEINRMTVFPHFYYQLAETCLRLGRVAEAVEAAQQGIEIARKAGDPRDLGSAWRILGMAIAQLSEPQGALPCFTESMRLLSEAGSMIDRARSLREWASYELRNGDRARGRDLMDEARTIFAQAGLAYELAQTPVV